MKAISTRGPTEPVKPVLQCLTYNICSLAFRGAHKQPLFGHPSPGHYRRQKGTFLLGVNTQPNLNRTSVVATGIGWYRAAFGASNFLLPHREERPVWTYQSGN
jgi:hypothetical protein